MEYWSLVKSVIYGSILIALIGAKLFYSFVSNNETIKMKIQNFEQNILALIFYLFIGIGMLISFLLIVPFLFLLMIIGLSISAFIPEVKKIRGRIIRIKKRESIIYYFSDYNSNSADNGLMLMPVYQKNVSQYKEIEHLVFLEEEESQKKYFVDLPEGIFDEIKEKRSSGLKNNIILFFREYLFFKIFDHFEIEPIR